MRIKLIKNIWFALAGFCLITSEHVVLAQEAPVLTGLHDKAGPFAISYDQGRVGLWQRLQKLTTTASMMHTTAHPDDEHAGMLTLMSRGEGVRTSMLTLNRGEAGANAMGPELFDALGLVRTEELRRSNRYYGLDDQYFTTLTDYGFSKTLEESLVNWGRENVLRDMVRIIRMNRPLVVVSRFHGSTRDGHGNHQAVGGITPEAVQAAGDPNRFPEQIRAGLRPWRPMKWYRGGVNENEPWHVALDTGAFSSWLGDSYRNIGYYGLSLQRSQTSGRTRSGKSRFMRYYERLDASNSAEEKHFFDGLNTSLSGIYELVGETPGAGIIRELELLESVVAQAIDAFKKGEDDHLIRTLAAGLEGVRNVLADSGENPEAAFLLQVKEKQFEDALRSALALELEALAVPVGTRPIASPWAPVPTFGDAVPSQSIQVDVTLAVDGALPVDSFTVSVAGPGVLEEAQTEEGQRVIAGEPFSWSASVQIKEDAPIAERYFYRNTIGESQYLLRDSTHIHLPDTPAPVQVSAQVFVAGTRLNVVAPVYRRSANLPYGYVLHTLRVVPKYSVQMDQAMRMAPLQSDDSSFPVEVDVVYGGENETTSMLALDLPPGWSANPASFPLSFNRAGERRRFTFRVTPGEIAERDHVIRAVVREGETTYSKGYDEIAQPDLDTRYVFTDAALMVRGMDVAFVESLKVGYIMGVGDAVPAAIEQLQGEVTMLDETDLAEGDLDQFDVIMAGTRAYAVRTDLVTYNDRLLEYVERGGHFVVLYQTPEYIPAETAPYPATLPRNAEEVSEEDAEIRILAPAHPVLAGPNQIQPADWEGWIEQRGSKFFVTWDDAYTAIVSSNDTGQEPQDGGWLMAPYGEGHFTYFAYAMHRQVPYAVPGAFRILANLLAFGQNQ